MKVSPKAVHDYVHDQVDVHVSYAVVVVDVDLDVDGFKESTGFTLNAAEDLHPAAPIFVDSNLPHLQIRFQKTHQPFGRVVE